MPPRITLKDIANKTGYAVITVSKALRDSPDIAEGTRKRIRQTAQDMGYVRNANALGLRSGVNRTIALIVSGIANPIFGVIAKHVEALARQSGYVMLLMNTDEEQERELEAVDTAISLSIGGVLIFPCRQSDASLKKLRAFHVPFVVLGRRAETDNVDRVLFDDERGGYLATKHLLAQGYRRILMLNADPRISSARERYSGYAAAHAELGLAPDERLSAVCGSMAGGCARLVAEKRAAGYDAIFAFNDLLAFEAMQALEELGLRVPEDVGVVGFDNVAADASYYPSLTSVAIPKEQLARRAMELLARQINGDGGAPESNVLDVALVVRESTRGRG